MSKLMPVLGVFGTVPFICAYDKVFTFNDLSRTRSVRWAKHDVIGAKPVLEYVGPELDKVSLKIRFDTSLNMPPAVGLLLLKKLTDAHESHILVIGGEYMGRFVIESVSETRKHHTGAGVCIVAEATLELSEVAL